MTTVKPADAAVVLSMGNRPTELAKALRTLGTQEGIDEERRLLYVAMTRARDALHLVEPLRHAVVQQPRLGAAYVHAARSRFMTRGVLSRLRRIGPPPAPAAAAPAAGRAPAVDVGARIRAMF